MFLSKLVMPLDDAKIQRLLSDPYDLHRSLMAAFPSVAGRVLFRVEPSDGSASAAVVIVQSEDEPSWDKAKLPPAASIARKPYKPKVTQDARLRFRLRANPTARKRPDDRKHGTRQGIITEEAQLAWLNRKGEAGGFRVGGCVVIDEGMTTGSKHGPGRITKLSFRSVRYEGTLTVTDAARFAETLQTGIGSAKAFGFGLLSVAKA